MPSDFWPGLIYIGLETSVALAIGLGYTQGTPINFLVQLIKEIGEEGTVYQLSIGEKLPGSGELKRANQGVESWDSKGDSELPLILSKIPFTDWQQKRKRRPETGRVMAGDSTFWAERKKGLFIPTWERWRCATSHKM